jgi:ubiquitin
LKATVERQPGGAEDTLLWLLAGDVRAESESEIIAAQDQALQTKYRATQISQTDQTVPHQISQTDQTVPHQISQTDQTVPHQILQTDQTVPHQISQTDHTVPHQKSQTDQTVPHRISMPSTGAVTVRIET